MAPVRNLKLPWFVLVFVTTCCSLLIAGCAVPGQPPEKAGPPVGCDGATCFVDVTVDKCDDQRTIVPRPDPVPVPRNIAHIQWTIQTAGYHFAENGIVINGSGFESTPGVIGQHREKFGVIDHHAQTGLIKYTIRLVRDSDGVACEPKDPMIDNQ